MPEEVWNANRRNGETTPPSEKPKALRNKKVDEATQPVNLPDNFTQQEQARADALGQQKLAAEKEAGRTVEQQRARELELLEEAK